MSFKDLAHNIILRDKDTFFKDFNNVNNDKVSSSNVKLIADFTEYNPLHNGHFHCMNVAKSKVPNGIFVAIVPGLFERSGRGIPYILPREIRAEIAISVGADIVVEGPPMGIMGSGQYSLALAKMFQALNTDFIPRGYNEINGFDEILNRIRLGHGIASKPYKIVDIDTHEILLRDKLEEDNYVIVSFSKSLKKINFDFKDKFIFVKRIGGVSGSLIRESISSNNFEKVENMMPPQSIEILKRSIAEKKAPLHEFRDEKSLLYNGNNLSFDQLADLNMFNEKLAKQLVENRPFSSVDELSKYILQDFSTHFKNRILSILEVAISKKVISEYIDKYPSVIRVLGYKNERVLEEFKEKINKDNLSLIK